MNGERGSTDNGKSKIWQAFGCIVSFPERHPAISSSITSNGIFNRPLLLEAWCHYVYITGHLDLSMNENFVMDEADFFIIAELAERDTSDGKHR